MITNFLFRHGITFISEGYCSEIQDQVEHLIALTSQPSIKILEIGFNAGNSSEVFLMNNKTCSVVSFDLGEKEYTQLSKTYIDKLYPKRHTLILGDSTKTLPAFIEENQSEKFDVFFIDGGHSYDVVKSDTEMCYKLAKPNSLVIIDDIVNVPEYIESYNVGPTTIWKEFIEQKKIKEEKSVFYTKGRGMAWGYFQL